MARAGITYTEVALAAKRLNEENKTISADNVRDVIGAGSKTTIVKHLNTWKDGHILESQANGIPASLIEALKGLWTLVKDEANTEIRNHQTEAISKIEAIEKVLHRHQDQKIEDQREKEALETTLVDQRHKILELNALLQAEQTEKIRVQELAHGLERQRSQQGEELARLHDIAKKMQINLEHYHEANIRLKDDHSLERENERNKYLRTTHALESELNRAAHEKAVTDLNLKHTEEALAVSNQMFTQLQENFKTLEHTVSDCTMQNALLEQRNQALVIQHSTLDKQHETLSGTLTAALDQVNLFGHKNAELETAIQKLQDKIQILSDEKLFIIQEKSELLGQIKMLKQQKI